MDTDPAHRNNPAPVLDVRDLTVAYRQGSRWLDAIRDVDLRIEAGQTYGLVGESGSGKTTLVLAVMRYLGANGVIRQGSIELAGQDLLSLSQQEMSRVWGAQVAMVPQDPQSSLNPSLRVGEQLAEILRHHAGLATEAAWQRAVELLEMVRLADPGRVARAYPHQISGGMQQRVLIAMALSTEPKLLILDEPTTSLDVTTEAVVLDLVRDLIRARNTAALYVTHNLGVVATICDRVAVLYAGELVEDAPARALFRKPLHPYTQGLLDSVPKLGESKQEVQLRAIVGQIPAISARPEGCVFAPRCPVAVDICHQRPPLYSPNPARQARCHRWDEISARTISARQPAPDPAEAGGRDGAQGQTLLRLQDIQVHFPLRRPLRQVLAGAPRRAVRAVDGVSLAVAPGQTLGLVGESGSGKTTLARAVLGLLDTTLGEMRLLGIQLPERLAARDLDTLRHLQMVFQNPDEALNPYMLVGQILRRPLEILLGLSAAQARARVPELLEAVRLPASYAQRLPSQLSGGEKQRVAIARAFASQPDLLICDEPVSSLDVSVQASILNLITQLQVEHHSSVLFISHDLAVVGFLADVVAVIYLGHLMETARASDLFEPPYHPYTEALLSAIPLIDPGAAQQHIRLEGDIPSPAQMPTGCPFHTRCPRFLGELCVNEPPPWQEDDRGTRIFCHIPLEELSAQQSRVFQFELAGEEG